MLESKKKLVSTMKDNLEDWREIILILYDLLQWKHPYCPVIVGSTISGFYLFLFWLDLTIITQYSLLLLFCFLINFFYPAVAKQIFKPDKWTGIQEKKLEIVVAQILDLCEFACKCWTTIFWKNNNSMTYLLKVSGTLLSLTWIGAGMNNLMLIYFITMFVCLWPGLSKLEEIQTKIKMFNSKISHLTVYEKPTQL